MAQLPPKVPSMTQNWPYFAPHQRMPDPGAAANHQDPPCWVDEFLDFSATRRGFHRRSASDSITFLEPPMVEECRNLNSSHHAMNGGSCFDRLDDEQLMSMFSDDIPMAVPPSVSSSNPSTPSDQNSNNNDQEKPSPMELQQPKPEPGEVESSCKAEQSQLAAQPSSAAAAAAASDSVMDPKRVKRYVVNCTLITPLLTIIHVLHELSRSKLPSHDSWFLIYRILANRQSAQRSRVRKLQYISELERSVTTLQVCTIHH